MKYVKMLGLLAVAAAALMAFAGTASATLTEGVGNPVDAGEVVKASSSNTSLDGSVKVSCASSTVEGTISEAGGTSGTISNLTFGECGKDTVTVLKAGEHSTHGGTLTVESDNDVISNGAEVTVQLHRTIIFPHINITTHCIYKTGNTKVGTLEESGSLGGSTAKLNIGSAPIPEVETDEACGNDAVWTGSYTVNTPDYLDLD